MADDQEVVSWRLEGHFAIITLNNPKHLNALTPRQYYRLATIMDEVDGLEDVLVTVLTGRGRFFSAGANIGHKEPQTDPDIHRHTLNSFVATNFYLTHAFARHSKILVAALNGPAVGGSAAIAAFADFIYASPHTYILTPFASLGLVAEIGTSYTLVQRLGISLANEAMLMGRKITARELVKCGFIYKTVDVEEGNDRAFIDKVMEDLRERFDGAQLNGESLLQIKSLVRGPSRDALAVQNVAEVFAGWPRVASGAVSEEMRKIKAGKKRHKL